MTAHELPERSARRVVYRDLSTDFWPWTEVLSDLGSRQPLSGVLDVSDGSQQAKVVWRAGGLLGVACGGVDIPIGALLRDFPRASVSWTTLDDNLTELLWTCRHLSPQKSEVSWGMLRPKLVSTGFRGLVMGQDALSFWEAGRMLSGLEPANGETPSLVTPADRFNVGGLIAFWNEILALCAPSMPLESLWRGATMRLADLHACLDPFAHELVLDGAQLRLLSPVPGEELLAALRAVFADMLGRSKLTLSELPLQNLRHHPLWTVAGPVNA